MDYDIKYTPTFINDLKQYKKHFVVLKELKLALTILEKEANNKGKKLKKNLSPNKSLRIVRKYRLIFEVIDNVVFLKAFGHRKAIYSKIIK